MAERSHGSLGSMPTSLPYIQANSHRVFIPCNVEGNLGRWNQQHSGKERSARPPVCQGSSRLPPMGSNRGPPWPIHGMRISSTTTSVISSHDERNIVIYEHDERYKSARK
ncbi:hypothetical protein CRG98_021074 [Punica granatum]|uniref:Uncharacterized protein n=1 Tax=Punica granatum TaxID=22663 RepID=A0A2I0JRI7_PUNGR|nr:hypothetical protein CRG98_021074 [Punica granatum]